MDDEKKSLESDTSTEDGKAKALRVVRDHWLAFLFPVLIVASTIIVVPILYSIKRTSNAGR